MLVACDAATAGTISRFFAGLGSPGTNTRRRPAGAVSGAGASPRRKPDGPFGTTIAHGYLTLALVVPLFAQLLDVEDVTTKLNYGLGKVRFPSPVPNGSRVRLTATVAEVTVLAGGGVQLAFDAVVHVDGQSKPACVAQPVFRFYP